MGEDLVTDAVREYLLNFTKAQRKINMEGFEFLDSQTTTTTQIPMSDLFPERDDSWSIIWYIASFSGLIAFFLIVSCSEWCCRLHVRAPSQTQTPRPASATPATSPVQSSSIQIQETPPPGYEFFAPPSYDSLAKACGASHSENPSLEKSEYDVYVVPVHAITMLQQSDTSTMNHNHHSGLDDEPPSYTSVQLNK